MKRQDDVREDYVSPMFTSCRFFCVNSEWFFLTRETEPVGPFENRQKAEEVLDAYLGKFTSVEECRRELEGFEWPEEMEARVMKQYENSAHFHSFLKKIFSSRSQLNNR